MATGSVPEAASRAWLTLGGLVLLTAALYARALTTSRPRRRAGTGVLRAQAVGPIGHGYGIVGTALIIANLAYLLRRRLAGMSRSDGSPRMARCPRRRPASWARSSSRSIPPSSSAPRRDDDLDQPRGPRRDGRRQPSIYRLVPRPGGVALQQRLGEVDRCCPSSRRIPRRDRQVARRGCRRTPASGGRWRRSRSGRSGRRAAARGRARRAARSGAPAAGAGRARARDRSRHRDDGPRRVRIDSNAGAALVRSWRGIHGFMAIPMVLSVTVHLGRVDVRLSVDLLMRGSFASSDPRAAPRGAAAAPPGPLSKGPRGGLGRSELHEVPLVRKAHQPASCLTMPQRPRRASQRKPRAFTGAFKRKACEAAMSSTTASGTA